MVFRDPADMGKARSMDTPGPDVTKINLNSFEMKWKEAECGGKKVLSNEALKQIQNLHKHVHKGCLSFIKPGRGTNRNEVLHRKLNSVMSSSRYGVELAYAILCGCFFNHNEAVFAKGKGIQPRTVLECAHTSDLTNLTSERFGLSFEEGSISHHAKGGSNTVLSLQNATYQEFLDRVQSCAAYRWTEQQTMEIEQITSTPGPSYPDNMQGESTNSLNDTLNVQSVKEILMQALSWWFTHRSLNSVSDMMYLPVREVPFMKSKVSAMFFNSVTKCDATDDSYAQHRGRLEHLLQSWNLECVPVAMDGNCLFTSTAIAITAQIQRGNGIMLDAMSKLRIDTQNLSVIEIGSMLRQAVVSEWTGDNTEYFQGFLSQGQLQQQAEEFRTEGVFSSDIGDLVIAALTNITCTPIVLITSAHNMPILIQSPSSAASLNTEPLFLAYTKYGPGHYDAVVTASDQDEDHALRGNSLCGSNTQVTMCHCGKKKNLRIYHVLASSAPATR